MYVAVVPIGLCVVFVGLLFMFPIIFATAREKFKLKSLLLPLVLILSLGILFRLMINFFVQDEELTNYLVHAISGGFMGVFVCWLAIKFGKIKVSGLQFAVITVLVVTTLGVGMEILESFYYAGSVRIESVNDTWLDLINNSIGILVSVPIFSLFLTKETWRLKFSYTKIKI